MQTVATLLASAAGVSISSVGLAFARDPRGQHTSASQGRSQNPPQQDHDDEHHRRRPRTSHALPMNDVAVRPPHPVHANPFDKTAPPYSYTTPDTTRFLDHEEHGRAAYTSGATIGHKRSLQVTPRASFSAGMDRPRRTLEDRVADTQQNAAALTAQPTTWLRRLSSSMSGSISRDSSQAPSRPDSAAVSYSNGSLAFSQTGSTAPMMPSQTPPPLPPNKLVKRTPSLRGADVTPGSGSRLPMPVFRRPATSHQRSATLRESMASSTPSSHISLDEDTATTRDLRWKQYFQPKIASEGDLVPRRPRTSSGIPNPIRRIYPDRRYTPVLVSARDLGRPASVVFDEPFTDYESDGDFIMERLTPSAPSSPLPQVPRLGEGATPRRSFSISDLLHTESRPLWRRPSLSRNKNSLSRRGRSRVASTPSVLMGNALSSSDQHDFERPAKRRVTTDARNSSRSLYSSSSSLKPEEKSSRDEIDLQIRSESTLQVTSASDQSQLAYIEHTIDHQIVTSRIHSPTGRPVRLSAAQSEPASTVGSESEIRSLGDTSTDYQSDHVFDSIPTRTTRSSSGRRGPHIETIFDDSPPAFSSGKSIKLRDFLSESQVVSNDHNARFRHSTIEEEGSVLSTPVRSMHNKSVTSTPSARPGTRDIFSSSPPTMSLMHEPDELDWDLEDIDAQQSAISYSPFNYMNGTPDAQSLPFRLGPGLQFATANGFLSTPQRMSASSVAQTNLFDWSEPQPSPSQPNDMPPRPRTVHGKKDQDSRGSRPNGRRAPSAMHARSHSVPVAPDVDGKRTSLAANKFGTWGVGSKAVTEDWDEDFDFSIPDTIPAAQDNTEMNGKPVDNEQDFSVPPRVKESQENVVANIGLLREWGLLIEELKELRIRANALDMLHGMHAQAWREVDAMIELADQESEEKTLAPRRSPPSSPGFDYDAFEDGNLSSMARSRQSSLHLSEPIIPLPETPQSKIRTQLQQATPSPSRPRKDSELVAQSVIAALQSKRNLSDPASLSAVTRAKKVPFDTATLRHIVPYVNGLKRKVKDALRETEGLYTSPRRRISPDRRSSMNDEPSFSSIFHSPAHDDSPRRRQNRRDRALTDHDEHKTTLRDRATSLTNRMQRMNLPT